MGDALQGLGAVLTEAALATEGDIVLGPTAAGAEQLPPPPQASGVFYLDPGATQWRAASPRDYEATTRLSEQTMAFHRFSAEADWILLSGPSGSSPQGHRWNQGGFDGVAIKVKGPLEVRIPDEKVPSNFFADGATLKKPVAEVSATTTNWQQNIEGFRSFVNEPRFNDVPRIADVRIVVDAAVRNARQGLPPPAEIVREATTYGEPAPVTKAVELKLASGTQRALPEEPPLRRPIREPRALTAPIAVPLSRTAAILEGVFQGGAVWVGPLAEKASEWSLDHRISTEVEQEKAKVADRRTQDPEHGVLIVVRLHRPTTNFDGFNYPEFSSIYSVFGYASFEEARASVESGDQLTDGNYEPLPPQYCWLPPLSEQAQDHQPQP